MSKRRGRPPLKEGEQSTPLCVRVANSVFDHVGDFSKQLGISFREAARIKLAAKTLTEDQWNMVLMHDQDWRQCRDDAKRHLAEAKDYFERSAMAHDAIRNMCELINSSKDEMDLARIAEYIMRTRPLIFPDPKIQ